MRKDPIQLDGAIREIEQAAFGVKALDAMTGVQFGGGGIEPDDFCTLVGELMAQFARRLDTAHRLLGGGGTGIGSEPRSQETSTQ